MKNKKSQAGIIIAIILGIIILGGIVTFIIIAKQKGWFERKTDEGSKPLIKFYIQAQDIETQEPIEANYRIDYNQNPPIIVSEGKIGAEWTELEVPSNQLIHFYCWSDKYYSAKTNHIFTPLEIQDNISKSICPMKKIGNLTITHTGILKEGMQKTTLNVSSDYWFYRMGICTSWTAGVIDISRPNQWVECDKGIWLNWSFYNATTETYKWLNQPYYRCGECEGIKYF